MQRDKWTLFVVLMLSGTYVGDAIADCGSVSPYSTASTSAPNIGLYKWDSAYQVWRRTDMFYLPDATAKN